MHIFSQTQQYFIIQLFGNQSQIASLDAHTQSQAITIQQKNLLLLTYYKTTIYAEDTIHICCHKETRNG